MFGKLIKNGKEFITAFKTVTGKRSLTKPCVDFHPDQDMHTGYKDWFLKRLSEDVALRLSLSGAVVLILPHGHRASETYDDRTPAKVIIDNGKITILVDRGKALRAMVRYDTFQEIIYMSALITHELAHVYQIQRGDLRFFTGANGRELEWKGTRYLLDYINALPLDMYARLPWEREAIATEVEYLKSKNIIVVK